MKTSRNIWALGWVSFFNDIASEMIYPIVPIFLTTVIGAPVAIVGLIEGIAEATASGLKIFSGWFSDKFRKRKIFIIYSYALSSLGKLMLAGATSWNWVLASRFVDRFGKGIRTSPRDALIAESSHHDHRGKAFGLHRGMDTAGAVLGPLLGLWLLQSFAGDMRLIFLISVIPAALGIVLLIVFVKDMPNGSRSSKLRLHWNHFSFEFKLFLLISCVFAIGNSSDAFLILRAKDLGLSTGLVILTYVLFNISYAGFAYPAGVLMDRFGARRVMVTGFLIFAGVYAGFGLIQQGLWVWVLFPVYGLFMAMTEGIGKAYLSQLVPQKIIATSLGVFQTLIAVCTFLASIIAGWLWQSFSPTHPFLFGSATAVLAVFLLLFLKERK